MEPSAVKSVIRLTTGDPTRFLISQTSFGYGHVLNYPDCLAISINTTQNR